VPETQYQIVSHGNLRPGFSPEQVSSNLQEEMKLAPKVAERLISPKKTIVKRSLDIGTAHKYEQKFFSYGLVVKSEIMLGVEDKNTASSESSSAPSSSAAPLSSVSSPTESELSLVDKDETLNEDTTDSSSSMSAASGEGASGELTGASTLEESDEYPEGYPKVMSFEFTGNGKEYFKIWIVNIVLTILTLGIYSAWAKVRNKQYFYGNTLFDNASFEYTAKPLQILKGRILAFIVVGIYFGLQQFLPPIYLLYFIPVAILFFVLVMPWVVVKGLQFNARHSTYRNISFGFDGTYWGAFKAFILWPLAGITIVLVPFAWQKKNEYFINNSRYGTSPFEFTATVSDYYRIFGIMIVLGLGLGIAFMVLSFIGGLLAAIHPVLTAIVIVVAYLGIYFVMGAYFGMASNNLMYNSTQLKQHNLTSNYELKSYAMLLFTNTLGILCTLGLFIPWALVRTARYHADHTNFVAAEDLDNFIAAEEQHVNTLAEGLADTHDLFNIDVGI
jgi:uncharacterized membrane protein YjgN (DUF898 family)